MDTGKLKTFAQSARRQLLAQVATRLEQVLGADSIETREKKSAIAELRQQIDQSTKQAVIERAAYTWFNRLCALRFMDVNHYTHIGIVSPVEGFTQPEILQEAKQGVIDAEFKLDRGHVLNILSGQLPSTDPQGEAYRLLLVGACNYYHQLMPFLFEPIADYTELLMPDDLLSENSILQGVRDALTPESCQDVEVIGWLYQFYISERKDEVFAHLKEGRKIEAKDIPAATQLFTPHWIVRYLVENSLGRLWMLNHPDSKLIEQMEYYIKPEQEETDFLRIASPEEIKVCDPACGSGHMLTYAFDLLYAIYEEQGYDPNQIPSLILQKNLFGIEIDERAGDLAGFALVMKARAKDRRFFSRKVEPNICVLQNVEFTGQELKEYIAILGHDLFTEPFLQTLKQFEQADNFGSLIQPQLKDVAFVRSRLEEKKVFENLFLHNTNQKVLSVLKQAEFLAPRYHIVLTNPPYLSYKKGMNSRLRFFAENQYVGSKTDLYSMFIERNLGLIPTFGVVGMITMHSWMFLSSFVDLRTKLLQQHNILSMIHLGPRAFDTIGGEVVSTTAFIVQNSRNSRLDGMYLRLLSGNSEEEKSIMLKQSLPITIGQLPKYFYRAKPSSFQKIPGSPIAYWLSNKVFDTYNRGNFLSNLILPRVGCQTSDNDRFLRYWSEVDFSCFVGGENRNIEQRVKKWYPYHKGGTFRRWYGNLDYVINWEGDGKDVISYAKEMYGSPTRTVKNQGYYFRNGITWSTLSTDLISMRYMPEGGIFDTKGSACFADSEEKLLYALGLCNSKIVQTILNATSPTLDYSTTAIANIPLVNSELNDDVINNTINCIQIGIHDWNSYEVSWDFKSHAYLLGDKQDLTLQEISKRLDLISKDKTEKLRQLEQDNNCIFIEAYDWKNELTPEISLEEITLTCNPYYRYGSKKSEAELEALLLADTMKEFISYAVGCIFGRYSLDKPGLILANLGETTQDYFRQIPQPRFPPDEDNVIPILEEGWFEDDITERFKRFLRATFGDEHYEENLTFIEKAIGRDIRSYFLKEFYTEHVQMYKKRPIYWLFSSPSGSFNALIYMHRYRPDTVSVVLNDYLREYVRKLNAHKAHLEQVSLRMGGTQAEKTKATKEINALNKVLAELKEYEDDVLYPLATRQIQIDLDDGVKVNYGKFGKALKRVSGLSE